MFVELRSIGAQPFRLSFSIEQHREVFSFVMVEITDNVVRREAQTACLRHEYKILAIEFQLRPEGIGSMPFQKTGDFAAMFFIDRADRALWECVLACGEDEQKGEEDLHSYSDSSHFISEQ